MGWGGGWGTGVKRGKGDPPAPPSQEMRTRQWGLRSSLRAGKGKDSRLQTPGRRFNGRPETAASWLCGCSRLVLTYSHPGLGRQGHRDHCCGWGPGSWCHRRRAEMPHKQTTPETWADLARDPEAQRRPQPAAPVPSSREQGWPGVHRVCTWFMCLGTWWVFKAVCVQS